MSTPNRLQNHWKQIKPFILQKWPHLTEADLESVDGEFDRLVKLVKERYDEHVQTVKEAHIRFAILEMLSQLESEAA